MIIEFYLFMHASEQWSSSTVMHNKNYDSMHVSDHSLLFPLKQRQSQMSLCFVLHLIRFIAKCIEMSFHLTKCLYLLLVHVWHCSCRRDATDRFVCIKIDLNYKVFIFNHLLIVFNLPAAGCCSFKQTQKC